VADLVGGHADCVVLGDSLATLVLRLVYLIAQGWQLGDEIVVSRLDADIVRRPLLAAARAKGVVVRWAEIDLDTGELPEWQYDQLINRRTRFVTVAVANPATGTVPNVAAIAELAHRHGALVAVDAGAAVSYLPLDLDELGADLLGISAASFGGPTVAAVAARPGLLAELDTNSTVPLPQRFEVGPLPVELLGGFTAAVEHLAGLEEYAVGTRRERLLVSVAAAGRYQRELYLRLDGELRRMPSVTVLGSSPERVPVVAFTVAGRHPDVVGDTLQRNGVSVWTGGGGLSELMTAFGADELGGAVYVGLMPHTTAGEIDQLVDGLRELG
jgi:selenocysteine lyase/cysteine desulfurase